MERNQTSNEKFGKRSTPNRLRIRPNNSATVALRRDVDEEQQLINLAIRVPS